VNILHGFYALGSVAILFGVLIALVLLGDYLGQYHPQLGSFLIWLVIATLVFLVGASFT